MQGSEVDAGGITFKAHAALNKGVELDLTRVANIQQHFEEQRRVLDVDSSHDEIGSEIVVPAKLHELLQRDGAAVIRVQLPCEQHQLPCISQVLAAALKHQ